MDIQNFFDTRTKTLTYIVYDSSSKDAVIIDPVLDFAYETGHVFQESIKQLIDFIREKNINVKFLLETHVHADHLSGAFELKKHTNNAPIAISDAVIAVQKDFGKLYNMRDSSEFDRLLSHEESLELDGFSIKTIHTPGHTPACVSYLINENLFTGDCLFMPDSGTGRCDFPGGSANNLYDSIMKNLYTLPDTTQVFVGHDYQPAGRSLIFRSTIKEEKENNIFIKKDTKKKDFIFRREERDKNLASPKLLLPSLQVNIRAGRLLSPESNGVYYLKIPLKISD